MVKKQLAVNVILLVVFLSSLLSACSFEDVFATVRTATIYTDGNSYYGFAVKNGVEYAAFFAGNKLHWARLAQWRETSEMVKYLSQNGWKVITFEALPSAVKFAIVKAIKAQPFLILPSPTLVPTPWKV